jgi:hypothetical protein
MTNKDKRDLPAAGKLTAGIHTFSCRSQSAAPPPE